MDIKIAISAGELSGDEHAADLIRAMRSFHPQLEARGMGGRNLRAANVETIVDCEKSAGVMGFQELLSQSRGLFKAWRRMQRLLKGWKPDLLVLVDFPDFNLRLARLAKSLNLRTFYFITPKLWAWRSSRVELFKRFIDRAAVIFPFEKKFFEARGYTKATFVGHPFNEKIRRLNDPAAELAYCKNFLTRHELDPERPTLALFPGSREFEIAKHLPALMQTVSTLRQKHPLLQAVLAVAPPLKEQIAKRLPQGKTAITPIAGEALDILRACDAGLLKSGTSNLQAAFFGLPFVMFFKASLLTELVVRSFVPAKEFSIVNVMRSGTVEELLQRRVCAAVLAQAAEKLLFDRQERDRIQKGLFEVVHQLSAHDEHDLFKACQSPYERAAKLALGICRGGV